MYSQKELVGVDIFVDNPLLTANQLGEKISAMPTKLKPITITSRGLKIWPNSMIETPYAHHACCRFQSSTDMKSLPATTHQEIIQLLQHFDKAGIDVIQTENLYTFDGVAGYTLAQDEQ